MLNPKDAQGLMEDMAVLNSANAGVEDAMRRAARNRSNGAVALAVTTNFKLQEKDQQMNKMRAQLHRAANERNSFDIAARVNAAALQSVIKQLAKKTGESATDIESLMNYERSRLLDQRVQAWMQKNLLEYDPRQDPEFSEYIADWYVPENF